MLDLHTVLRKSENVYFKTVNCETVLIPLANNIADMNSMFELNDLGTTIWNLIDGIRSIEDILSEIVSNYEIDLKNAKSDLFKFLKEVNEFIECK